MKKYILLLSILIVNSINLFSQINFSNFGININYFNGYSFAPNKIEKTQQSLDGWVQGLNFGIHKQVNGNKDWHQTYGNPRIGLNLQTIFMNKPDTFGFHVSLIPFIQINILKSKNSNLSGKIGIGGAYASKSFKFSSNFDNRAVSLPLNFALEVGAVLNKKITNKLEFNFELGYFHLSNGSFQMPNGGFNIYYSKTGLSYFFNQTPLNKTLKNNFTLKNKTTYYTTYMAGAYREQGTFAYRRQFPIFIFHNAIMRQFNKVYNYGLGFDLFYDATQRLIDEPDLLVSDVKESDKWNAALGFCNELNIGKLAVPLDFYHYVYDLNVVKQKYYIRFGLTYYPYKKLFVGCYFKGSINKYKSLESDFMEFALGWRFRKQN
jgi:hypothetical protein